MIKQYAIALLFFTFPFCSFSQVVEHSGWIASFNSVKLTKNWGMHLDIQLRSADDLKYAKTLLLRPGLTYFINDKQNVTAGYALVQTFSDPDLATANNLTEHRLWEQFIWSYKIKNVALAHRFRLEQRFIERPLNDVFSQRIRYFVRGIIPIVKASTPFTKGTFVGLQNEVFFNIQNKNKLNNSAFDQNRAYISLGYRLSKKLDAEVGYLNQYVKGSSDKLTNHVAQVALYSRF